MISRMRLHLWCTLAFVILFFGVQFAFLILQVDDVGMKKYEFFRNEGSLSLDKTMRFMVDSRYVVHRCFLDRVHKSLDEPAQLAHITKFVSQRFETDGQPSTQPLPDWVRIRDSVIPKDHLCAYQVGLGWPSPFVVISKSWKDSTPAGGTPDKLDIGCYFFGTVKNILIALSLSAICSECYFFLSSTIKRRRNLCVRCGYPRLGSVCPECGNATK